MNKTRRSAGSTSAQITMLLALIVLHRDQLRRLVTFPAVRTARNSSRCSRKHGGTRCDCGGHGDQCGNLRYRAKSWNDGDGKIGGPDRGPENPLKEISALHRVEFVMQEGRIAESRIEGISENFLQREASVMRMLSPRHRKSKNL